MRKKSATCKSYFSIRLVFLEVLESRIRAGSRHMLPRCHTRPYVTHPYVTLTFCPYYVRSINRLNLTLRFVCTQCELTSDSDCFPIYLSQSLLLLNA